MSTTPVVPSRTASDLYLAASPLMVSVDLNKTRGDELGQKSHTTVNCSNGAEVCSSQEAASVAFSKQGVDKLASCVILTGMIASWIAMSLLAQVQETLVQSSLCGAVVSVCVYSYPFGVVVVGYLHAARTFKMATINHASLLGA